MNLLASYEKFKSSFPVQADFAAYREAGRNYFLTEGLPNRKNEDWHYTSVRILEDYNFMPGALKLEPSADSIGKIKENFSTDFINIVFYNGCLNENLSEKLPAGVNLKKTFSLESRYADAFEALNAAYLTEMIHFEVECETSIARAINIIFFNETEDEQATMVHPRITVSVGKRSSIKILESYCGDHKAPYFVNSVCDLILNESAKVIYVRRQSDGAKAINIGRTGITLAKDSNLESLSIATGAKLSRHSLDVNLKGPGCHAEVLGVYTGTLSQHIDNTTRINYFVGENSSNQLYKGILDGEARAVFNGKVIIQKDAQKANSSQLNNTLLLSNKAESDSKPNLEIFADDVKASHGSTVGQLNREELFYLQSRAIPKEKAISMLSYGFLSDVLYKISDETVRHWLSRQLEQSFSQFQIGRP